MTGNHTPGMIHSYQGVIDMSRITVSLPSEHIRFLDSLAGQWKTTRSGAVARLITESKKRELHEEMAAGYAELAELNKGEAALAFAAQSEVVFNSENGTSETR